MAMSTIQFCMVNPMAGVGSGTSRPALARVGRIRCQTSEDPTVNKSAGSSSSSSTPQPPSTPPPPPPPAPKPKVSTKFNDVLAFGGPAPERINGRLAMVGFMSAIAVELANGSDVITQVSNGGVSSFLLVSGLLSAASLVPLFKGVSVDSTSGQVMSSKAEMWNGRLAMLGLVALVFTEYLKGGPLV